MIAFLNLCPFCGSAAERGKGFLPAESIEYVWCSNTDCELSDVEIGFTPESWNYRAPQLVGNGVTADLEAQRALFEAWALKQGLSHQDHFTRYQAWLGWQAAIASQAPVVQQELTCLREDQILSFAEKHLSLVFEPQEIVQFARDIESHTPAMGAALSLQADAKDAARYRWLRNQNIFDEVGTNSPYVITGQTMTMLDGEELDTAVDDAIKRQ